MGRKKRNHPGVDEILSRPWCYYCERDFDDQKVLINHQKAKHFKCERCGRRLNTAGGLSVHMSQVHKETLSAVDNALPNRAGLDIEIFGMEGIPEDIIQQHNQRVLTQFHQDEAERRAGPGGHGGGTAGSGSGTGNQPKKPKFESPVDLKKRLAEHKAKLATEQANGGASGGTTPSGPGLSQSTSTTQAPSPMYPQQHTSTQAQSAMFFANAPASNTSSTAAPGYGPPAAGAPFHQGAVSQYPPQSPFSPPPFHDVNAQSGAHFAPSAVQPGQPPFAGAPPGTLASGSPRPFGAGSPVQQSGFLQTQPPRIHTPPQPGPPPQRSLSGSFSPAPGLPQRPSFGAPLVNHFQLQQMHQGQVSGVPNSSPGPTIPGSNVPPGDVALPSNPTAPSNTQQPAGKESSLDELISGAAKQAEEAATSATTMAESVKPPDQPAIEPHEKGTDESVGDKKAKKDKSKPSRLVYSDQDVSPEEKMARMSRYAFTPTKAQ